MKFIARSPRNYTLAVLFNTDRECHACREADKAFGQLAEHFADQHTQNSNSSTPAFFFRVPFDQLYALSQKIGLVTVPALFYITPSTNVGFPKKAKQFLYFHDAKDYLSFNEMGSFINDNTPVTVSHLETGFSF